MTITLAIWQITKPTRNEIYDQTEAQQTTRHARRVAETDGQSDPGDGHAATAGRGDVHYCPATGEDIRGRSETAPLDAMMSEAFMAMQLGLWDVLVLLALIAVTLFVPIK